LKPAVLVVLQRSLPLSLPGLTSADWVQATRIMMLDWLELEEVSVRVF